MCNGTVIDTPMKSDEQVQINNKKRSNVVKQTEVERLKIDRSDRSVAVQRVNDWESSKSRTRLQHDIELAKELLRQLLNGIVHSSPNCVVNEVLLHDFNAWSSSGRFLIFSEFNASTVGWKNLKIELSRNPFKQ